MSRHNSFYKVCISFVFIVAVPAFAAETSQEAPSNETKSIGERVTKDPEAVVTMTNCYTNVNGCAGSTYIFARDYDLSCSIWWGDQAGRVTNFRVSKGQTLTYFVRTGDTGACIGVNNGPPKYDGGRWYLYVK